MLIWHQFCTFRPHTLKWRHNERNSVSNHQRLDCLLNCLFRPRSKKTSNLSVTGLCAGNSPVTGEFPTQKDSNAEIVSIWWRHYVYSPWNVLQMFMVFLGWILFSGLTGCIILASGEATFAKIVKSNCCFYTRCVFVYARFYAFANVSLWNPTSRKLCFFRN